MKPILKPSRFSLQPQRIEPISLEDIDLAGPVRKNLTLSGQPGSRVQIPAMEDDFEIEVLHDYLQEVDERLEQEQKDSQRGSVKTLKKQTGGAIERPSEVSSNQNSPASLDNSRTLKNNNQSSFSGLRTKDVENPKEECPNQPGSMSSISKKGSSPGYSMQVKDLESLGDMSEPPPEPDTDLEVELNEFLRLECLFEGKNFSNDVRKAVIICRAIFTNPQILLIYEDALDIGQGVSKNLRILCDKLPQTAIICITKNASNLLLYDRLFFMDAGKLIEKGDPFELLLQPSSYIHRFLNETDANTLLKLQQELPTVSRPVRSLSCITGKDSAGFFNSNPQLDTKKSGKHSMQFSEDKTPVSVRGQPHTPIINISAFPKRREKHSVDPMSLDFRNGASLERGVDAFSELLQSEQKSGGLLDLKTLLRKFAPKATMPQSRVQLPPLAKPGETCHDPNLVAKPKHGAFNEIRTANEGRFSLPESKPLNNPLKKTRLIKAKK